jgi:hypothetical protein
MNIKKYLTKHIPVLFYGHPGVGKTEKIKSCFEHVEVMLASSMVEEDISGLPYRDGVYDKRTIPIIFKRLEEADAQGKTTAIFFDELDKARRSVSDSFLTLICNRAIGNSKLPDNTCIIAAANNEFISGSDGISEAMQSRFCCIDFIPDPLEWYDWAIKHYKNHIEKINPVLESIKNGEINLYNMLGEGHEKRITSPRTISLFLTWYCNTSATLEEQKKFISGLLCPLEATYIINKLNSFNNTKIDKIFSTSKKINSASQKYLSPLRL